MLTPAEAERLILDQVPSLPGEDCPVGGAAGRVLRQPVLADRDLPPFDRATMDGYALRSASLRGGTRRFRVEGLQAAGMIARRLGEAADACVEIMTGAVLPIGADCVVPSEHVGRDGVNATVDDAGSGLQAGHAIHRRGSDCGRGRELLPAGTRLTPQAVAVAAACGYPKLTVAMAPKVAVIATGDELVEVEMAVADHQVRRSNDYALRAALIAAGYPRTDRFHLRDVPDEIEHRVWHLLAEYDFLVLCGGVSKGRFDHIPSVLEKLGVKRLLHGVAQRPGKPMWFGMGVRRAPVFALPGNPVSAFTCLHRYVIPALQKASGLTPPPPRRTMLAAPVRGLPGLTHCVPVTLETGPDGVVRAHPHPTNTSGDFIGLVGTDGFVELAPSESDHPAGAMVPFRPWAGG